MTAGEELLNCSHSRGCPGVTAMEEFMKWVIPRDHRE